MSFQKGKQSSLLAKYTEMYKNKPNSRVFAPLAETYRKIGMFDEAFKVLKKGIKQHPQYTLGYIVLANCYYDRDKTELAYNLLRPLVENNLENISLQKLFSKICEDLGYQEEALMTCKYLLLLNPSDKEMAKKVKSLEEENKFNNPNETITVTSSKDESGVDFENEDDWIQVSFNSQLPNAPASKSVEDDLNQWSMSDSSLTTPSRHEEHEVTSSVLPEVHELGLDDEYYHEEYDNEGDDVIDAEEQSVEAPIITHTLVDLFLKQGHKDKAIEILKDILELHPTDQPTLDKLAELEDPTDTNTNSHDELLNLIDAKRQKENIVASKVEEKLQDFLSQLKERAVDSKSELS